MNPQSTHCSVSLCLIARNSEATLARTLGSIASLVSEIIVVDTGSSDSTVAIAQRFGAKVLSAIWEDDFSAIRNIGLNEARERWILVLDSDEWMQEKDVQALRNLLLSQDNGTASPQKAFRLLNRSLQKPGQSGGTAAYLTRLFPNRPEVRYCFPIHEQVDSSLQQSGVEIENVPIHILHDGYCDPVVLKQKQERNLRILQKQILSGPSMPITLFLMAGSHLDLGQIDAALDAYLLCFEAASRCEHRTVADAALIRIASCLARLNRWQEALPFCERISGPSASHPELVITHAKTLAALGRRQEATAFMESVLSLPDIPRLPPCDHQAALFEAIEWTANEVFLSARSPQLP